MSIAGKLLSLGLELPPPPKAVGLYRPALRSGQWVITSGQLPMRNGELSAGGKVPSHVSLEDATHAARLACLNALSAIAAEAGSLESVCQVVRLNVYVNSTAGFTDLAKVANGASQLLIDLFGQAGRGTRCAIGAAELPLNAAVELDLIVELR